MEHDEIRSLDPFGRDILGESAAHRAAGPVVEVSLPGGIPAFAVTGYDRLRTLILDSRVSKDPRKHWKQWPEVATRPEWAWLLGWVGVVNMLSTYGLDHTRLRKLVAPSFTARRTEVLRPRVESITTGLLDALEGHTGPGPVDLRSALANPLPLQVICELFGVPDSLRPDLIALMSGIMDTTATPEDAAANLATIDVVLGALIEHKRETPGDDLTTELITVRDTDGDRLSDEELRDTLLLVIGAGHETTVNLIGNAIHALLTHPEELRKVRSGVTSWDQVVSETLRWAPSIANLPMRFAIEDIEIPEAGGFVIPAGSAILTTYAAAGHDPAHYGPTAHEFDPGRDASDHLSFGIGAHRCIGAPLARLEAGHALPALFDRYPGLRLADADVAQIPSFIAHGWATLPVRLEAEVRAGEVRAAGIRTADVDVAETRGAAPGGGDASTADARVPEGSVRA
ncbi:cytochrome P450 family protein [Streptomyces tsukubensis]|uniref:Cytochrome n=1 Tax=Streptomyces tsukubensis TaxID=83656 RepID=A0A1V4AE88_9ACTN|nr:cytochrome P450 [Streptomyces tsukubensis]OON81803.1 cytochrome [Streptomyces tsukubensis]QFR96592.1 cytochrome P450 [Streptomyces tsukubensis]